MGASSLHCHAMEGGGVAGGVCHSLAGGRDKAEGIAAGRQGGG